MISRAHLYGLSILLALASSLPLSAQNTYTHLSQYLQTLSLEGIAPAYDKLYGSYLLPLPKRLLEAKELRLPITYQLHGEGLSLHLNGRPITSGQNVRLSGETDTLSVYQGDRLLAKAGLCPTFMPVVLLETSVTINGQRYTPGRLTLIDPNDEHPLHQHQAKLRYRGVTAQKRQKKAFAVKLIDRDGGDVDASFMGLRQDNDWILDAMAIDLARMRNRVSTDLWHDFSSAPYQKEQEPKALNATRGHFVEVILNGSYQGIYCMTEKIDRKQLRVKKLAQKGNQTQIKGLIYKAEQWSYAVLMGHDIDRHYYPGTPPKVYRDSSDEWDGFEMSYPEVKDGEPITWRPLYEAIRAVASNDVATFAQRVDALFDLPVVLDYNLFVDLLLATDNHGKNMYYYIYDLTQSPKLGITPWDLDGTWGRDYYSTNHKTADPAQSFVQFVKTHEHGEYTLFKRLREAPGLDWERRLKDRYAELRRTHFAPEHLAGRFARYAELFARSGADRRERRRWHRADGLSIDIPREVEMIQQWIRGRVAYLDRQFDYKSQPSSLVTPLENNQQPSIRTGKGYLEISSPSKQVIQVYDLTGRQLVHQSIDSDSGWEKIRLAPGLYLVNGLRILVP